MNDLLLCPFCGANASVYEVETDSNTPSGFVVACNECGISTPASDDEQKVIYAWNNRVPSEREYELEKLLAALVDAHYDELAASGRHIRAIHQARDFLKADAD